MTTTVCERESATKTERPKDDFPFDPYMLLETRLKTLRLYVMNEAVRMAEGVGQVERRHVEAALAQLAKRPEIVRSMLVPNE